MINNRQNGRRGRGRNGVRPQGGGGGTGRPEQGNRIDNRARGNAAQLLEKYKALARDAQMASDRVMTEYYLQFADHYFRVLADTRARLDEQRRPQGEPAPQGANSYQDDDYADDGEGDITDSFDDPRPDQQPRYQDRGQNQRDGQQRDGHQNGGQQNGDRQDRQPRQDRDRGDRGDRPQYDRAQNGDSQQNGYAQDRAPRQDRQDRQDRPFRNEGQRQDRQSRGPRDDGQDRGNEGQTYRTIRAEPSSDRGPVTSPLAQAQPPMMPAAQDNVPQDRALPADEAPRRTRTRRPAPDAQPVADAFPPAIADEPVMAAPVDEAPRRERRPRLARAAVPVDSDGSDQIDRVAFLSTPAAAEPATPVADATPTEEKPRRRRRPRAEADTDTGDVAA